MEERKKQKTNLVVVVVESVLLDSRQESEIQKGETGIKILVAVYSKCNELESAVSEALMKLNMEERIDYITDFEQIASYGVMSTLALVIDSTVLSYGKVLTFDK